MQSKHGDLRSGVWKCNSLACTPGPTPDRGGRCALVPDLRGLFLSLRGAGISDKLTQELELGQEEMPNHIPTWG